MNKIVDYLKKELVLSLNFGWQQKKLNFDLEIGNVLLFVILCYIIF